MIIINKVIPGRAGQHGQPGQFGQPGQPGQQFFPGGWIWKCESTP